MKKGAMAVGIVFVLLFLGFFVLRELMWSTPIPAANEKERAYFEKRKIEWDAEQQRLKDIE
jgi:hypothetical protein